MDKAREAAVYALERVRRDEAWSSALTDTVKTKYALDDRSMSLAVGISLGVLQNMTLCDFWITSSVVFFPCWNAYQITFPARVQTS